MDLITTTQQLEDAIASFSGSEFVAVDTEFIRETTFWPELCLIQMATPDKTALVDPLSKDIDLAPFFDLMADPAIMKVFHAARQDIEIVHKLGGLIPAPLFDSQVAAMVCGFGDSISYDQLVMKMSGIHLDKTSRFTDWRQRPLTDTQLTYALADVTHLAAIYPTLKAKLEESGRGDWVKEEMATLSSVDTYELHPENAWKRLKMRVRKPIELVVLQKVAAWRETEARERNVPRSRVIKDDTIYEIAQQQPKDQQALGRLRTVPNGWERSSPGQDLLKVVQAALETPKDALPKLPRHVSAPEGTGAATEMLRVLLKLVTEENGVAAKVVATSDDLDQIASKGEEADVPAMHGWRRGLFGDSALRLIRGEVALKFEGKKIRTVELPGPSAA
ncbi:MAG: ribonuclease D [Rhizobiaceae bacterium]